jgi:hypothetical protein
MAQDRFVKACLVVIALLLSIIAFNSIMRPQASHAAVKYSYQVVVTTPTANWTQPELDKAAAQGWELVATPTWSSNGPNTLLIFRRPSK